MDFLNSSAHRCKSSGVMSLSPGCRAFFPGSADVVLGSISNLATGVKLRGLILDLRGNGGGTVADPARLLGAFIHGKAWSYDCDVHGRCTPTYTDSSVPLLHLPLVVLTDRNCASACDAFSGAVKDLRLGTLVGTRTAGIVAAPPRPPTCWMTPA